MKNKKVFRSLLSVLLALTMLVQLVPMSVFAQSSVLYGDVNSDDAIDNTDVDLLARYLTNETSVEIDEDAAEKYKKVLSTTKVAKLYIGEEKFRRQHIRKLRDMQGQKK